jgi:hypothetical protein
MTTTRRPRKLRAVRRFNITPKAVEAFRQMHQLPNCTCKFGPMYWNTVQCDGCERWWDLHNVIHDELNLCISAEWPAVAHATPGIPHDKIAGGRVYQRDVPQVTAPAEWDKGCRLFDALTAAAGIASA